MGISNTFTYNGKSSSEFGILIDSSTTFKSAERDYETVEVPGRNGDLTLDNGRYRNYDVTYTCGIGLWFKNNINAFKAWLMSNKGYNKLSDSYRKGYYRMARVRNAPDPALFTKVRGGIFDVVFDCKPQLFMESGDIETVFTASGSIYNPTHYEALPLIRVYGTGALSIGSTTITINSANTYTDIDCDIQDCFKGSTNCNGNVTLNSGDFFRLLPGTNNIVLGSGISRISIKPRWWTL